MSIVSAISDPHVVALLASGGIGVLPTDTIYGVVASASHKDAVQKLYELKHRDQKPGTVIAATVQQLIDLGVPRQSVDAVAHLWPNPISVDLLVGDQLEYLALGTEHCAFRVVADPTLQAFLAQTGPLLTSSANQPAEPPAIDVGEAQAYFDDDVDFYVDGGRHVGSASTVVRYRDGSFVTRRQGPIFVSEDGRIAQS